MTSLYNTIEKFIYHIQTNKEHYQNPKSELNVNLKNKFSASLLAMLISYLIVYILLLFLGKWIWNRHAVEMITVLKPINSIIPLLGLSILVKLLVFV